MGATSPERCSSAVTTAAMAPGASPSPCQAIATTAIGMAPVAPLVIAMRSWAAAGDASKTARTSSADRTMPAVDPLFISFNRLPIIACMVRITPSVSFIREQEHDIALENFLIALIGQAANPVHRRDQERKS